MKTEPFNIALLMLCLLLGPTAIAQYCGPLSGNYIIGDIEGSQYQDFNQFVTDLAACGTAGEITLDIAPGIYSITQADFEVLQSTNDLIIRSSTGNAMDANLVLQTDTQAQWLIKSALVLENVRINCQTGQATLKLMAQADVKLNAVYFSEVDLDVRVADSTNLSVDACEWVGGSKGLHVEAGSSSIEVSECLFIGQTINALTIDGGSQVKVSDNVVSSPLADENYVAIVASSVKQRFILANNILQLPGVRAAIHINSLQLSGLSYSAIENNSIHSSGGFSLGGLVIEAPASGFSVSFNRIKIDNMEQQQPFFVNSAKGSGINYQNNLYFNTEQKSFELLKDGFVGNWSYPNKMVENTHN